MATSKVDMSLDDIIQMNKKSGRGGNQRGRGGRGRGGRGGRGRSRGGRGSFGQSGKGKDFRGVARGGVRGFRRGRSSMPYVRPAQLPAKWQHDLFEGGNRAVGRAAGAVGGIKEGTLMISNLEFGVNDSDINELFGEFGPLKKAAVHYDRSGRSLGTAEVIFENVQHAVKAMKQYNNVPLDGQPMRISLVGADAAAAAKPSRNLYARIGLVSAQRSPFRARRGGRGGGFQARRGGVGGAAVAGGQGGRGNRGRAGGRGGFRGNRRGGRSGGQKVALSKEDLDAQLDAYNSKMDTN